MNRYFVAALAAAGVLGLFLLPYPFFGDQALFTWSAEQLHGGAVLYTDVWDDKQPGLSLFYLAGGVLFGFDEVGIHLFELIYVLAGASLTTWLLRDRIESAVALGLVPLLTVGVYYASIATTSVLTQLEWLVGFPMFLSLWYCTVASDDGMPGYWVLAGALGGVVLLFKGLLIVMVAPTWLAVLVSGVRSRNLTPSTVGRAVLLLGLGVGLAWLPFAVYVWQHGLWDTVVFTYLSYPLMVGGLYPRQPAQLARSVVRFCVLFAPLLLLAGLFVWRRVRSGARQPDAFLAGLHAWLAFAGFAILIQYWWPYHFYLLLVPLGVLAALGLDRALRLEPQRRRLLLAAGILGLPLVFFASRNAASLARHGFAMSGEDRLAYQVANYDNGDLGAVVREVAFLRDPAMSDATLYVLGDPVYLYRAGRAPATSIPAWSAEIMPTLLWDQSLRELQASRPPFVFIQSGRYTEFLQKRGPHLKEWIDSAYEPMTEGAVGVWYRRRSDGPP